MKVQDDYFASSHIKEVSNILDYRHQRRYSNDVMVHPEPVNVIRLLDQTVVPWYRRVVSHPYVQISDPVYQLGPNVPILGEEVTLESVSSRQIAMLVASRVMGSGDHQSAYRQPSQLPPVTIIINVRSYNCNTNRVAQSFTSSRTSKWAKSADTNW